jgi:xanthine dehydrogenase accessory factor
MRDILHELQDALQHDQPVAYSVLVETRGSTPQKAGATMLVFPDGSQAGTLGGGCVEAEVKRRALQLLDQGAREILTFQLDGDYGWDDGLICGGRMSMLVDPVRPGDDVGYFETLNELIATDEGCTEAVLFDPDKAGGGTAGDRYLLDRAGRVVAARVVEGGRRKAEGGGRKSEVGTVTPPLTTHHSPLTTSAIPRSLLEHLRDLTTRPRPYVAGGVSYLPRLKRCRLVIVGGGHVGQKVAELAADADFDIWVIDDREQYCNPDRFPFAKRLIVADIDAALSGLDVDESTFCIIVTRGHNHDEEALYHLAEKPAKYVGLIGSRRKIKLIFEDLLREGISPEALERVHAPLGFDIGSQTVPEIAVSIVAELIACRNLGELPEKYRKGSLLQEVHGVRP